MYELHGVTKLYRQGPSTIRALDEVRLAIGAGELLVVEGPSGSGKSTLLQILGGLDRPTRGLVRFEAHDLTVLSDRRLTRLRLSAFGFVFQQFNLIPTLTAAENVEAALAPTMLGGSGRRARVNQLLNRVGLGDRARHLPSQLSGGEQQRVAIARALANQPRVILADEPTGNLDSRTGREILELLTALSAEHGKTVVVVTHDREVAARAARVVRMRDGRLTEDRSLPQPGFSAAAVPATA